jgi:excisionase family DNA binding protein
MTLAEVARTLQLSEKTVRRLVAARRMPCVRLGRQLRFLPSEVFRWVEARKED